MNGNFIEAIRGPLMLIAVGTVLAADQLDQVDLSRTWPALLILFGLLKLAEHVAASFRQPPPSETGGGPA